MPTGVQGRLAGFKGVFFRHPDEAKYRGSLDPQIWVRDSQVKVHHGAFDGNSGPQPDRAMLVFDILSFTRTSPGRLSAQFITNMSFNGVPTEVFERLLQDDMEHLVRSMTTWEGPNALPNLVHVLEVEGGLRNRRLAQLAGGEAKARGFRMRESDTRSGGSDRSEENGQPVVAVDTSGLSPIWEERCADLLKASFKPQDTAFLHRTLKEVIRSNLQRKVEGYHVDLPCSASDPTGTLEPGEVYFRPSVPLLDSQGYQFDVLEGDCVMGRHPCMLPSDLQKVRAVNRAELGQYRDVVVCATRGRRSLASLLAGGDYDGDKVVITWYAPIVTPFEMSEEASERFATPPAELASCFEQESAPTLAELVSTGPLSDKGPAVILRGLRDKGRVGLVANFHLVSAYMTGYDGPETVLLAHMHVSFSSLLDSAKSGRRMKEDAFRDLSRRFGGRVPAWSQSAAERKYDDCSGNQNSPRRPEQVLGRFVMDSLMHHGQHLADSHMEKFPAECGIQRGDPDLVEYWDRFQKDHRQDADEISTHVQDAFSKYRKLIRGIAEMKAGTTTRGPQSPSKDRRQQEDELKALGRSFASGPVLKGYRPDDLGRLRATCAYQVGVRVGGACGIKFPFEMAFSDLCAVKARCSGKGFHIISADFHRQMQMNRF
ncbi:hypothetical protein AURDEDRAFT_177990 [Auricularia subglabra TFB-10046 SS5]|uniref:RNA-dependent RNA polymerase n=1 Tax=Auricularia subglabra (strain TFB-10046 / SS5) TaxID=717982 RepID=J0WKT5_AURST|nr:hypothetical protein AURDEDRAFT_177990 [Auricularia subglabra TFB-10046 SS5]